VGRNKVLVVGIDGLRWDRVSYAEAPNLTGLARYGMFAPSLLDVSAGAQTMSGPGWSTLASGVWPDRHGVRDNSFNGAAYGQYPDFLTRLKRHDPSRLTFVAVDWPWLITAGTFGTEIDLVVNGDGEAHGYRAEDARITATAVDVLRQRGPDAAFVYLGCVDEAGHASGAMSDDYTDAISRADGWLGDLLGAVARRPADENWLVLVTTDHGHCDGGGHGGYSDAERATFVLAEGRPVPTGWRTDVELVDVAAAALAHLGVPVPDELAGRSFLVPDQLNR
jgi:predicted AlkP superfamily pyrophosphatase or phosphodiesterase